MSTISVSRPMRRRAADPGSGQIELTAPPRQTESMPITGSMGMILVPAASGVGAVLLAVTQQSRPLLAAAGLLVLAASITVGVVMVVGSRTGDRRRTREQRERYLDYLEQVRHEVRNCAAEQIMLNQLSHPSPTAAGAAACCASRRWERRPADADFLTLRIGLGAVGRLRPLRLGFQADDPLVSYDQVCLSAAMALLSEPGLLANQPILLPLSARQVVSIRGPQQPVRAAARALLAQLSWAHSPDDAGVVLIGDALVAHWDWLKWLPHNNSGIARGAPWPRLTARTIPQGVALINAETEFGSIAHHQPGRRLVVLVDGPAWPGSTAERATLHAAAKTAGAVLILLHEGKYAGDLVDIQICVDHTGSGSIEWLTQGVGPTHCSIDQLDIGDATVMARSFAPLRPADASIHPAAVLQPELDSVRFVDVSALDPALTWQRRAQAELLRVPIGVSAGGALVALDLKEAAAGGMGPHGLVIGATGSGKSELLRTLVTTLAISHSPATLALLLADFKGGATFSGLAALPHIAGMVTNLEADLGLIDRFRDALSGELQRRQELLAATGKLSSLDEYQRLQQRQPGLPALPRLLVIVDEFSELLGAKPDLAELFVTIGRIGRSIGIHLLLATQRLDTGRIRGLESHLSYRICLRTFSEAESREAIGSPAAYRLPAEPGWAYLLADTAEPVRFRASTVSRPYRQARKPRAESTARILPFLVENHVTQRISDLHGGAPLDTDGSQAGNGPSWDLHQTATILDVVVDRLATGARTHPRGHPVRRVWLEPLPTRLELGTFLDTLSPAVRSVAAGPTTDGSPILRPLLLPSADRLTAPIGLVDIPERQRQDILNWDFDAGNGNLLIVGAGRSGKSEAVGTLMCSLGSYYGPSDIAMICLDFGGESLLAYRELPHVVAVATRSDPELLRLVLSRIRTILDEREALFRQYRFDSAVALRQARESNTIDQRIPGAVVLMIDGWAGLRDADLGADAVLDDVLSRGPGLGVYTVLTVSAVGQLRTRLAAGFGGRIELRLGDSFDSAIDRRLAKALPANRPGRALVAGSHYAQIALPQSDSSRQLLLVNIQQRWPGTGVPRITTLPATVSLAEIRRHLPTRPASGASTTTARDLLLGVAENDMKPVEHSLSKENPHLLIYGDTGSGKTTLLRLVLSQLMSGGTAGSALAGIAAASSVPDTATATTTAVNAPATDVLAVDYRRGLPIGVAGYRRFCRTSEAAALGAALSSELSARLSGAPAEPSEVSEIFLLVDDYELVGSVAGNPLTALLPFLPHARDIGFHLILARRSGGAARAQYEPLLQALGDLGTPVILLSGAPTEGRLGHGLVPRQFPPGRAQFAMRGAAARIIQIGWTEPR